MSLDSRARSAAQRLHEAAASPSATATGVRRAAQARRTRRAVVSGVAVVAVLAVGVSQLQARPPDVRLAPGPSEVPTTEPAAPPSPMAVVRCTDSGPVVVDQPVAATSAGVHLRFKHPPEGWAIAWGRGNNIDSGENTDRDGVTDLTVPIPPGRGTVECAPADADGGKRSQATLQVVDPRGVWRDDRLVCPNLSPDGVVSSGESSSVTVKEYSRDEVVPAVKKKFDGPVDVELVGYPEARNPVFRVVRDGEHLGMVHTLEGSGDTVTIDAIFRCPP